MLHSVQVWPSVEEQRTSLQLHLKEIKSNHHEKQRHEVKRCWQCGVSLPPHARPANSCQLLGKVSLVKDMVKITIRWPTSRWKLTSCLVDKSKPGEVRMAPACMYYARAARARVTCTNMQFFFRTAIQRARLPRNVEKTTGVVSREWGNSPPRG